MVAEWRGSGERAAAGEDKRSRKQLNTGGARCNLDAAVTGGRKPQAECSTSHPTLTLPSHLSLRSFVSVSQSPLALLDCCLQLNIAHCQSPKSLSAETAWTLPTPFGDVEELLYLGSINTKLPSGAPLQEKHIETAKQLLGQGKLLNDFVSRLLNDIANLKAMLHAISIGGCGHLQILMLPRDDTVKEAGGATHTGKTQCSHTCTLPSHQFCM